ncbi:mycofactocin-coupled SDR family oxidoreductase [Frankia sp. CNm7]|uniref:Mycofactocin-coupled SDR family oxidoreductase n=1 Tax=Frankia nepalensis TaxID=1836974 RepID=A0A937R898_9ACTN|nr:mycofactocin-coupled SDR family oxidoreductase [Frankia nepalensis]MBL7496525.1 mycofactocin-coupled SDR family oxidoreductase [Frankia nepalensis]MBL7508744.1 mycofactocin-coupled SDR family oxidoreductase [Frankia nepalensis]MBL7523793.1 mycofactocin-coupled SDR family oxidoreductase [Frankia nepalensis]MBL7627498.1 mycofactocin-coupled SDR family oxidoreductase [Frankia nepalensis]
MGKFDGKVAFITGAARGQGRSHAVRLAAEGASIIAIDICAPIESASYGTATPADLDQTVKEVEALGGRIVARQADVRDVTALRQAFDEGTAALGPVDIVVANAGIGAGGSSVPDERQWDEVVAVNMTGVWNTGRVAIPSMVERGQGGSIILTSSTGGLVGVGIPAAGFLAYTAAKHGVIGLMRSWANYLAPHFIRVNSIAPTAVRTPMAADGDIKAIMERNPALANALTNAMPVDLVEPIDISNAVLWLASDEARYVTGTVVPVDAGLLNKR